jgi:Fe-S oxidoreductase
MSAPKLRSLDYSVLQQCMHCGMCLPSCPTYAATGRERHSPRGRIALMRSMADGELKLTPTFAEEMSYCLGCLACTSACPAGVDYGTLLETARAEVETERVLTTSRRDFLRWLTMRVLFTRPRLLRFAGRLLWLYQVTGLQRAARKLRLTRLLPRWLRESESLTPTIRRKFSNALIAPVERPRDGVVRRRVLVLTGCMQDLMFSEINRATVDVLLENGCEVHTPPVQFCCGSLHAHNGDHETALFLARRQLDEIDPFAFDAIISNAGGCGSHLRHYGKLLADDEHYAARATEWSRKLRDIHEWLVEIGFRPPPRGSEKSDTMRVTYHESCHLCHGQKVSRQPREILRALPRVELMECVEANWCCGSAGIYNLTQPATASWLQRRKVGHLRATGAMVVATANPGCHLQIENGIAQECGGAMRIAHPVVLLAEAYHDERASTMDAGGKQHPTRFPITLQE